MKNSLVKVILVIVFGGYSFGYSNDPFVNLIKSGQKHYMQDYGGVIDEGFYVEEVALSSGEKGFRVTINGKGSGHEKIFPSDEKMEAADYLITKWHARNRTNSGPQLLQLAEFNKDCFSLSEESFDKNYYIEKLVLRYAGSDPSSKAQGSLYVNVGRRGYSKQFDLYQDKEAVAYLQKAWKQHKQN